MKRIILLVSIVFSIASCRDFLKEEMVATITQEYFKTEQGLDQLIVNSYNALRFKYGWQDGLYNFESGHDIGTTGTTAHNTYNISNWRGAGATMYINDLFGVYSSSQMIGGYPGINDCNYAIEAIRNGAALGKYAADPQYAATRLSEVLFNRAWWYYMFTTQLGDVYVSLKSNNSVPENYNYVKSSSQEIYSLMIGDLRYAFDNLPTSATDKGRHTKYTAAHFLAKLYLQRAQGAQFENSSEKHLKMLFKGNVSTDLDSALYFANQVIAGPFTLEPNYWSLFDVKLGNYANENSNEIIMAAGYGSVDGNNGRYGMRSQGYFTATYVNTAWGLPDRTWTYGSNNTGFRPSDFGYDVFTDKIADSRFEKSFRVEYDAIRMSGTATGSTEVAFGSYEASNSANATTVWTEEKAKYFNDNILPGYKRPSWEGRTAVAKDHKTGTGDIGLCFVENTKATAIKLKDAEAQPYSGLWIRWIYDEDENKYYYRPSPISTTAASGGGYIAAGGTVDFTGLEKPSNTLPCSKKHIDPNRAPNTNAEYGTRNVTMFRLAETYLIRAEVYGRKGQWAEAINDINVLRRRAAYKAGEVRAEVIARLYPGSENLTAAERTYPYTVATDKTNDMLVDATYWDGASAKSAAEQYPTENTTGINDNLYRFINFIQNEYAREMNSEYTYIEVIHHAGTQADRIRRHQQMAAPSTYTYWDVSDNALANGQGQTGKGKGDFANYHTFRPFPQTFLDMLTDENNVLLDDAAKAAYQNPGYN
ncbi:MAG: RagB/SusD family nutrient uptake outer membrane protein [Tannerella sp.]|nr:RagB/SusD family nutrient uptake outer membrane protein [Tannerella sp.]